MKLEPFEKALVLRFRNKLRSTIISSPQSTLHFAYTDNDRTFQIFQGKARILSPDKVNYSKCYPIQLLQARFPELLL